MNKVIMLVGLLSLSGLAASAQDQNTCRELTGGGAIQPDEVAMQSQSGTLVACRNVKPAPTSEAMAPESAPAPNPGAPVRAARVVPFAVQHRSRSTGDWYTPTVQFGVGYQYNSLNASAPGYGISTSRVGTNGGFAQVMVNLNRYFSPVGSVDFSYKNVQGANYLLTYVAGVQGYPLSHNRLTPFGRAMVGAGTVHITGLPSETGFTWQAGGGVDWRFGRERRMSLRLATFDYARWSKSGLYFNSLKIGTGIVF